MFRLPLSIQISQQSLDECLNTLDKLMLLTSFLYFHFCITTFLLDSHGPPVDNSRFQRGTDTSCCFAAEEGRKPSGPMPGVQRSKLSPAGPAGPANHVEIWRPSSKNVWNNWLLDLLRPSKSPKLAKSFTICLSTNYRNMAKEKLWKAQLAKCILRAFTVLRTNLTEDRPRQLSELSKSVFRWVCSEHC